MPDFLTEYPCPHCGENLVDITDDLDEYQVTLCTNHQCGDGNAFDVIFCVVNGVIMAYCVVCRKPSAFCQCQQGVFHAQEQLETNYLLDQHRD